MKTWFCKDKQQWVSELPRAFWVGEVDYLTKEKIYSDEIWVYKTYECGGCHNHGGINKYKDVRTYKGYVNYKLLPYTHIYGRGRYEKVLCKKI